ncbi:DUF72 domain-containing protein [Stenotrophomonas sp. Marseille-Q4652]|uniref:DUF72 domain-containing protein n=1 Tax=Stenotrophomonas sp. Marseille-Q4652 TaxID=2866595 RepID=UPI001CE3DA98|nr:DUF72 domain-containing protein [Stenotrophomonas sp. Marseille-Q4652]
MTDLFDPAPPRLDGIHVGIGGWTFAPWRGGMFYPEGLVQRRELEYASRQLTAIEINGTYYGTQKAETYARWRDETPEGFVFTAKAPKRITASRKLSSTGPQVDDFIGGIATLGDRLAALLWQFAEGYRMDADEFAAFLQLLPARAGRHALRHAVEIRDPGFVDEAVLAQLRAHNVALVFTDSQDHPSHADLTADFCYARLMRSRDIATGYTAPELAKWADRLHRWRAGEDLAELPHVDSVQAKGSKREVFTFFISSAKHRNPAAAMKLQQLLTG